MNIVEYTEFLVKSIVVNPDMVKVESFEADGGLILEVIVHDDDKGIVIGRNGNNIRAIRTLINAKSYQEKISKVRINVDSF
jgi:predicted RNA-binding protein YlqC (UPF0109 family)